MSGLYHKDKPLPRDFCGVRNSSELLDRIYYKLGASSRSLPKAFKGKFDVDGHTVVVFPSASTKPARHFGRSYKKRRISGRKYGLSRVFFLVGKGRLIPAGRIHQSAICGGTGGRRRRAG